MVTYKEAGVDMCLLPLRGIGLIKNSVRVTICNKM